MAQKNYGANRAAPAAKHNWLLSRATSGIIGYKFFFFGLVVGALQSHQAGHREESDESKPKGETKTVQERASARKRVLETELVLGKG